MKIFLSNGVYDWNSRINFVDENNVFVGYVIDRQYSEDFGWFIANEVITNQDKFPGNPESVDELNKICKAFNLDPLYFNNVDARNDAEDGGVVIFKLTDGVSEKYLHLYNYHNGYYSHDFSFEISGKIIKDGCI